MTIDYAQRVVQWIEQLGSISEESGRLTRRFATGAMQRANAAVADWMGGAGMTMRQDNIGNLWGRYEADRPDAPTLLLGSHLDTVRDAGKWDGPLGVLVALACVQHLHDQHQRLPFALEIIAFADEEGLRYHTTYLGSSVVTGTFDRAYLEQRDADGITMLDAIRVFGGDPEALTHDKRAANDLLGYLEVHMEQGPVLEARALPVGVVTAISGQSRFNVRFRGEAGHAGTVPMDGRHDALCAAAEFVLQAEALARAMASVVATVGQLAVQPGASNVIPGLVTLSLDVRHADDAVLEQACQQLYVQAKAIAQKRGMTLVWNVVQQTNAVPCSSELRAVLAQAIRTCGHPVIELASGAGHDAAVMARLSSMAMLFVRCRGGISHNPAEYVAVDDVAAAINVLGQVFELLAQTVVRDHSA